MENDELKITVEQLRAINNELVEAEDVKNVRLALGDYNVGVTTTLG